MADNKPNTPAPAAKPAAAPPPAEKAQTAPSPSPAETAPAVQGRSPNAGGTTETPETDIPASAHASPGTTLTSQQFEGPKSPETAQPLANPGVAGGVRYPEPAYQAPKMSSEAAAYRCITPHFLPGDKYVEAGTTLIAGRDVPEDWVPSMSVEPLNDAAKKAWDDRFENRPKSIDEALAKAAPIKEEPKK